MLEKVDMSGFYVCPWVLLRSDCLSIAVTPSSAVNWGASRERVRTPHALKRSPVEARCRAYAFVCLTFK